MMVESDHILVTNGVSGDSTPLLDATRERAQHVLLPMLQRGQIPMVRDNSQSMGTNSQGMGQIPMVRDKFAGYGDKSPG